MTQRLKILLFFVGMLVLANIGFYLQKHNVTNTGEIEAKGRAITAGDFTILSATRFVQPKTATRRELFRVAVIRKKPKRKAKITRKPEVKKPPEKTAEQLERERVVAELANAHLVGVIKRGAQFQAYIEWNGETYLTKKGQVIRSEFETKVLSVDYIVIEHRSSGTVKKILISGE